MSATLYERLGGVEGITRLVDDALLAHLNNPIVNARLKNAPDLESTRRKSIEFFCAGSGGPQTYSGLDALHENAGLAISEQEFVAAVDGFLA